MKNRLNKCILKGYTVFYSLTRLPILPLYFSTSKQRIGWSKGGCFIDPESTTFYRAKKPGQRRKLIKMANHFISQHLQALSLFFPSPVVWCQWHYKNSLKVTESADSTISLSSFFIHTFIGKSVTILIWVWIFLWTVSKCFLNHFLKMFCQVLHFS